MSFDPRRIAKEVVYSVWKPKIAQDVSLKLGMVVHTERIFDVEHFAGTAAFCRTVKERFGIQPVLTLMTGANMRVRGGMKRHGCSDEELADRFKELAEHAVLGLHGHFWMDPELFWEREAALTKDRFHSPELEIRANNFVRAPFIEQLDGDLEWFAKHDVSYEKIYAAGWWFTNEDVLDALISRGFEVDFSFSPAPWFRSQYSHSVMVRNIIPPGRPFRIDTAEGHLLCVQTLTGCGDARSPEDLARVLRTQLEGGVAVGALSIHDYDRNYSGCLAWLAYARDTLGATLWNYEDLRNPESFGWHPKFQLETL